MQTALKQGGCDCLLVRSGLLSPAREGEYGLLLVVDFFREPLSLFSLSLSVYRSFPLPSIFSPLHLSLFHLPQQLSHRPHTSVTLCHVTTPSIQEKPCNCTPLSLIGSYIYTSYNNKYSLCALAPPLFISAFRAPAPPRPPVPPRPSLSPGTSAHGMV